MTGIIREQTKKIGVLARRSFLALFTFPRLLRFAAARHMNGPPGGTAFRNTQFIQVTSRIVLPATHETIVLEPGDRCGMAWLEEQGARRAVLVIQRAGDDVMRVVR